MISPKFPVYQEMIYNPITLPPPLNSFLLGGGRVSFDGSIGGFSFSLCLWYNEVVKKNQDTDITF